MAQLTLRQVMPQLSSLTGRRVRRPLTVNYANRFALPSLASMVQEEPEEREVPRRVVTDAPAGAGLEGGPSVGGVGETPETGATGEAVGNQMALSSLSRGGTGLGRLGLQAAQLGVPASSALAYVPAAFALSALAPLSIPATIAAGVISGNAAETAVDALEAENISPELTAQTAKGIVDATYSVNPLTLAKNLITDEPQEFASDVADLTVANAPMEHTNPVYSQFHDEMSKLSELSNPLTDMGLSSAPVTGNEVGTTTVSGLVEEGAVAPQGGPTGGNTSVQGANMSPATGHNVDSPGESMEGTTIGGSSSAYGGGKMGDVGGNMGSSGTSPGGSMGPAGTPGAAGMDAGPAPGGDSTVICTELHRQGLMSDEVYKADSEYGKTLPEDVLRGYYWFGIPLAGAMRKSRILTAIVAPVALKWANHMAGDKNWFGKAAIKFGIPLCSFIGKLKKKEGSLLRSARSI